jgi:hypothetical protein
VRTLRPGMSALTEAEVRSLPGGSLMLWCACEVFIRTDNRNAPGSWCDPEGNEWREPIALTGTETVLIRVGPHWTVTGNAADLVASIAEVARTDPAFREEVRRATSELRDLAEAIDQLDPRTRR